MFEEASEGLATSCCECDDDVELVSECKDNTGRNSFIVVSRTKLF